MAVLHTTYTPHMRHTTNRSRRAAPRRAEGRRGAGLAAEAVRGMAARQPASARELYAPPAWGGPCADDLDLGIEVLRSGVVVARDRRLFEPGSEAAAAGALLIGRAPGNDIVAEHPSTSRCHAAVQGYRGARRVYLYDNASTHGVTLNKRKLPPKVYVPLRSGDMFKIGASERLYVVTGEDADESEGGHKTREAAAAAAKAAAEAATNPDAVVARRAAQQEAAAAEMRKALRGGVDEPDEDASGSDDEELGEVDWRTYQGTFSERQQKLVDKIRKKETSAANMLSEIERIRAKEGMGSGLSQGQLAQAAKNEQRVEAVKQEIEDLEVTLNESLAEGKEAKARVRERRAGVGKNKRREAMAGDDDDDFFDRTGAAAAKRAKVNATIAVPPAGGRETLAGLWGEHKVLKAKIEMAKAELGRMVDSDDAKAGGDAGEDTLDAFMGDVGKEVAAGKRSAKEAELAGHEERLAQLKERLLILDPAGAHDPEQITKRKAVALAAAAEAGGSVMTQMLPPPPKTTGGALMPPPPAPARGPAPGRRSAEAVAVAPGRSAQAEPQAGAEQAPLVDSDGFMAPGAARQQVRAGGLEIRRPPPAFKAPPAHTAATPAPRAADDPDAMIDALLGGGADSSDDELPPGAGAADQGDDGSWLIEQERKQAQLEAKAKSLGY